MLKRAYADMYRSIILCVYVRVNVQKRPYLIKYIMEKGFSITVTQV